MTGLFLIARIAGRTVAFDANCVESVVDVGAIVPVPRTASHVCGLTALRSRVVTVIDSSVALGLGRDEGSPRAVISACDGHYYAFLVEALEDVASFEQRPLSNGVVLDRGWAASARGMVERDGEPILVIDPGAMVAGYAEAA